MVNDTYWLDHNFQVLWQLRRGKFLRVRSRNTNEYDISREKASATVWRREGQVGYERTVEFLSYSNFSTCFSRLDSPVGLVLRA